MYYDNNLFIARYTNNIELTLFSSPLERASSSELLYGRVFKFSSRGILLPITFPFGLFIKMKYNYEWHISAGISRTGIVMRKDLISADMFDSKYSSEKKYTIGFPIETELILKSDTDFGIGGRLFANLNKFRNVWGYNINIYQKIF